MILGPGLADGRYLAWRRDEFCPPVQSDLHGQTHLWLQRVGGRVHRRRTGQHRLVGSERRTAPVLERLRAGDRPIVLRAAALRTDVRVLADRPKTPGPPP